MCCYRVWQVLMPEELCLPVVFRPRKKTVFLPTIGIKAQRDASPLSFAFFFKAAECSRHTLTRATHSWKPPSTDAFMFLPGAAETYVTELGKVLVSTRLCAPPRSPSLNTQLCHLSPFSPSHHEKEITCFVRINMGCILITVHLRTVAVLVMLGSLKVPYYTIFHQFRTAVRGPTTRYVLPQTHPWSCIPAV